MPFSSKASWLPFWFAIALSAICLAANLAGYASTGNPAVAIMTFLCFLPMAFFFVGLALKQSQDFICALEERIRLLEAQNKDL